MQVIEFENKYKEKTRQLIIDVAIHEHGFKEWKEHILKFENEFYKENNGNCWIAINEFDEVVGTISLRKMSEKRAEVKNLYIHSGFRQQGIAQNLLDRLFEFAKANGYTELQLDTYSEFSKAMKLYEKNGFVFKDTIDNRHIFFKEI